MSSLVEWYGSAKMLNPFSGELDYRVHLWFSCDSNFTPF